MSGQRAAKYAEKSEVINFRITPGTKRLLNDAAKRSGRSLSSECEVQLQRALDHMGDSQTYAVMMVIGKTIGSLERIRNPNASKRGKERWWNDAFLFDQARQVVLAAFGFFQPPVADFPKDENARKGKFWLEATLREIQLADPSIPIKKQTPHQRWLNLLKRDLGSLVDRPAVWGLDADSAREQRERATPILEELIPLSRKNAQTPKAMSAAEKKKLGELFAKLRG
jgi:TraY domain